MFSRILPFLILLFTGTSCQTETSADRGIPPASECPDDAFPAPNALFRISVDHATGFTVVNHETYREFILTRPWPGATEPVRYLLVPCGVEPPDASDGATIVQTPVRTLVTTSTSHLPGLRSLGILDAVVGHSGLHLIQSADLRGAVERAGIREAGSGSGLNVERILRMNPDLVMTYAMGIDTDAHRELRDTGLTPIINADFLEPTPLGRSEWIKFMAAFFHLDQQADSLFSQMRDRYEGVRSATREETTKTAFSGSEFEGSWYIAGDRSYMGQFLEDAGARYAFPGTEGTMTLDFESVIDKAGAADIWIGTQAFGSRLAILEGDERYAAIRAARPGGYFWYDGRIFEDALMEPDVVLADLVSIVRGRAVVNGLTYFESMKSAN